MKSVNSLISGQISTEEEALVAVEEHPETLTYIPEHLLTENVLFEALVRKSELFKHVQEDQYTHNLVRRLLTHKPATREFIPSVMLNESVYLQQVREDGMWLQHVPIEERSLDMCIAAINQNVNAHEFVPSENQTTQYLDALILIDPQKLIDVAVENRSPSVVKTLVDNDYTVIRHLPLEYRTKEICAKALGVSIFSIQWFPDEVYEHEEVFNAILNHPYFENPAQFSEDFSRENEYKACLLRPKLISALIDRDANKHFPLIPVSLLTIEDCKKAIQVNARLVIICPPYLRKRHNLWEAALAVDHTLIRSIRSYEKTGAIEVLGKNIKALNKDRTLFDFLTENQSGTT